MHFSNYSTFGEEWVREKNSDVVSFISRSIF